jgi:signal transduction histidine kinase
LAELHLSQTNTGGAPHSSRWTETLLGIARRVARWPGDLDILETVTQTVRDMLSADTVLLTIVESDGEHVRIIAASGTSSQNEERLRARRYSFPRYVLGRRVYGLGETVTTSDVLIDPYFSASPSVNTLGSRAFCIIPLKPAGKTIGALSVHFASRGHDWTEQELEWLKALTDQAALVVMMSRNLQDRRRDISVRDALHTASQRLQSAADLDTVLEATMEGVAQVVPSRGIAVHLLNKAGTEATIAGLWGYERSFLDVERVQGFKYPSDDSGLNRRTLIEHEAFFLRDFQVEAEKWNNTFAPTLRAWMSVPLMSQGRCFGKITVDHDLPDVYGPEEVAIVQTFAAHAASAIERAYLYSEMARRADQLAALHEISQELVAASDEQSLYEILRRRVFQTFVAEVFFIALAQTEADTLDFPILIDDGVDYARHVVMPHDGPVSEVLRTGKPLMMRDRAEWNRYRSVRIGNEARASKAAMFAPLVWSGVTLGVISIQTYLDRLYTHEEFQAFQALAATTALALGRIRSEEATDERARQFAALAESARAVVSNLEVSDVLQKVVDRANELTGGEAFLMLYNSEEDIIRVRAFAGRSPWHEEMRHTATLKPGQGVGGQAFSEQRTIVVQDMQSDERALYRDVTPMRSLVVLPLTVGGSRMGILELAWPEQGAVTPDRLSLCTAFADHAALAIHNARQHDELRQREAERTVLLRQLLTAQEAERKRVSIDLHDGPLQSLGVGLINADTLRKRAEQGHVTADDVDELRLNFAAVVDEIRDLMADLRPEVLDSYGLLPALEAHARRIMETTELEIRIDSNLPERLPPYIEVLVYRLVQESLSNVRKHSHATDAVIVLDLDEARGMVVVIVADNGRGFDPRHLPPRTEGFGVGLSSMVERTESAGGSMTIESAPGKPTTITFQIPLPTDPAPESSGPLTTYPTRNRR